MSGLRKGFPLSIRRRFRFGFSGDPRSTSEMKKGCRTPSTLFATTGAACGHLMQSNFSILSLVPPLVLGCLVIWKSFKDTFKNGILKEDLQPQKGTVVTHL